MTAIEEILKPVRLTTLKGTIPSEGVKVYVIRDVLRLPKTPIILPDIFPFSTVEDIKNAIWLSEGGKDSPDCIPRFLFLGYLPKNSEENGGEFPQRGQLYLPADYLYYDSGASVSDPIILQSPLDVIGGEHVDERFVDSEGRLQPLKIIKRERVTLEDLFLPKEESTLPVFHAFTLSALKQLGRFSIPMSEYDFNGRLAPYFPSFSSESSFEPTNADISFAEKYEVSLKAKNSLIANIQRLLDDNVPGLPTPVLSGITRLYLLWKKAPPTFNGCEGLFYDLPVNKYRPFVRLLPVDGTPLTKLYSPEGSFSIPEIISADLIKQWAQEKAPMNDSDYLFAKILLHEGGYPVFGSFHAHQDGTADFVLMPPKNVRKLSPGAELSKFSEMFNAGLEKTGYNNADTPYSVGETSVISFIKLDSAQSDKFTTAKLQHRLQYFAPFFQEIAPLSNEQPMIVLRYKRVSNFAFEDRIFTFLTQVIANKQLEGTVSLMGLPKMLAAEFDIPEHEAEQRILAWRRSREQFGVADAAKNDIKLQANAGTDISIHAQHPLYFFHIHRAESGKQLARIYTLLSMLFGVDEDEFKTMRHAIRVPEVVETTISPSGVIETAIPVQQMMPGSPQAQLSPTLEGEDFAGYDFDLYEVPGDEEPEPTLVESHAQVQQPPIGEDLRMGAVAAVEPTQQQQQKQPHRPVQEAKIVADSFYIKRLKELDKTLFVYKKEKGDKSLANYSVGCAANEDRQPLIMDELQYKRMRDIYDEDEDLIFIEYPLRDKKNPTIGKDKEVLYVLKYGSDPSNQNYFVCSEYFCIRDDIILRKHEFEFGIKAEDGSFEKTKDGHYLDRERKPKNMNECPFCHGKVIKEKDSVKSGETVLKRKNKPKKDIPQLFIRFLTKKKNPDGLSLPCCFVDPDVIRYEQPDFNHIRIYEEKFMKSKGPSVAPIATEVAQEDLPEYGLLRLTLHNKNIVDPEKYPLPVGKVGICPIVLDKYLGQVTKSFIEQISSTRQGLKPNAEGFLRIGVQNGPKQRNNSLLAALAPLLGNANKNENDREEIILNTPEDVISFIKKSISPLIFQSLNFGNLVMEFYNPSDPSPTQNELELWTKRELHIEKLITKDINIATRRDYIERLYNSYKNFIAFLENPAKPKELRQFVHMLAEPGVLTKRGLIIITLDYSKNPNLLDTEIIVRCPLQGYSTNTYMQNDFAFLTHDPNGIWEPLIYTRNIPASGSVVSKHYGDYTLQASQFPKLPNEIQVRIREFKEKCNSSGLGAYTSQIGVKPDKLIPKYILLYARETERVPVGLVRDAYNHLVAATFLSPKEKLIAVPLADDGSLDNFSDRLQMDKTKKKQEVKQVFFGWEDIQPLADTDEIIRFYTNIIKTKFEIYKGYAIESVVKFKNGKIAVKLVNQILIPAANITSPSQFTNVPVVDANIYPEWYIDNQIVMRVDPISDQTLLSDMFIPQRKKEIEEVFQHLRYTFANYLGSNAAGPELRKKIKAIIEPRRNNATGFRVHSLDLWERRKRLQILLGSLIRSWLNPTDEFKVHEKLLRIDCTQIADKGACDNYCSWKESSNQCLIHSPNTIPVGQDHNVSDAPRFFMLRLLEELLRIPEKRRQLLDKEVSYLSAPKTTTRIGDQLIIPEVNAQWYQLLIDETLPKSLEKPIYYEEFSRISAPPVDVTGPPPEPEPLSTEIIDLIGHDVASQFQLWQAEDLYTLLVPLNIRLLELVENGAITDRLTKPLLDKIVDKTKITTIQIDLTGEPQFIGSAINKITDEITIIIITESGEPAFLVDSEHPMRPYIYRTKLGNTLQEIISKNTKIRRK